MRSALLAFLLLLPRPADAQIPVLSVSTNKLSFLTSGTSQLPPSQQVRIRNAGSGTLGWRATASVPWIQVSPSEGTAPSAVMVSIDTSRLTTGDYSGRVVIEAVGDADDSPATIEVTLRLVSASRAPADQPAQPPPVNQPPPAAAPAAPRVDQPAQAADAESGQVKLQSPIGSRTPVSTVVELSAPPGRGAVAWTARTDSRWITVEPSRGTTPASVSVKASPGDLQPGEQRGTVQFVDLSGMPLLTVPVVLSIGENQPDRQGGTGLTVSPTMMPPATRNMPYTQAIPIKGGRPPYSIRVLQGRLPPGLVLSNGAITGISGAAGSYQFTLGVADSSMPPQTAAPQMWIRVITIYQNTALMVLPPTAAIAVSGNVRPEPTRLAVQSGGQALDWHASTDANWLRLVPSEGISPGFIQLEVAPGLPPGSYYATVTVMMEGVPNSPARIPVQVTVRR